MQSTLLDCSGIDTEQLHLSRTTVFRAVTALTESFAIRVVRKKGKVEYYRANFEFIAAGKEALDNRLDKLIEIGCRRGILREKQKD